ncbi:MAG: bifunctional nuclease domain-containing protein [Spirochaetota bacterium]
MIEVKILDISLSNLGFVVLLQSPEIEKTLPIFIGMPEAQSIAIQYNEYETPRPLTHDLFKNMLNLFDCDVEKVIINDYKDHSYYAKIFLKSQDDKFQVDARPSDAITLALKFKVPIFVDKSIMENYSIKLKDDIKENTTIREEDIDKPKEIIDENDTNPEPQSRQFQINEHPDVKQKSNIENLKEKLNKAVAEERYEDAASIRDELKKYEEDGNV